MNNIFVKPGEGRTVRYPDQPYRTLGPEGDAVPPTQYWLRRINDGDVVVCAPQATKESKK